MADLLQFIRIIHCLRLRAFADIHSELCGASRGSQRGLWSGFTAAMTWGTTLRQDYGWGFDVVVLFVHVCIYILGDPVIDCDVTTIGM